MKQSIEEENRGQGLILTQLLDISSLQQTASRMGIIKGWFYRTVWVVESRPQLLRSTWHYRQKNFKHPITKTERAKLLFKGIIHPQKNKNLLKIYSLSISIQSDVKVHLKTFWISWKRSIFLSLISERETHMLYRLITQSEIFQAFISWHFDDYGLQIIKTPNSVSQKIRILHKINKKWYFKQKFQASEKYVHFYALNTWLGHLWHELLHQCGVAWRQSACGTAQV